MTRPTPEMETAYGRVAEAVDALDEETLAEQLPRFMAALESGPDEVQYGAGASLADLWLRAELVWPSDPPSTTDRRREMIVDAIDALDRRFPVACIGAALDQACEQADCDHLNDLLVTSPTTAAIDALDIAASWGDTMGEVLGETVVRCLLVEGARLERLGTAPPAELPATLRVALSQAAWLPEGVTRADLAVIIAMMDYYRDDLTRLDETLDEAEGGPFKGPSSEGYLAVLRAAAAIGRFDVVAAERMLREAAGPVVASNDPSLITGYRAVCDLMARTRRQRIADPFVEVARLKPNTYRTEQQDNVLLMDVFEQFSNHRIDDALRDRLAEWREIGHSISSAESRAALWAMCACVAVIDGQMAQAHEFAAQSRGARALMPSGGFQATLIDQLLATFDAASALGGAKPQQAVESWRTWREQLGNDSNSLLVMITDAQQALLQELTGEHREALRSGVKALTAARRRSSQLPGSSERLAMMEGLGPLHETIVKAAGALGDAHLMAEVLEFLRAQDVPIAHRVPSTSQLPLAHTAPTAVGEQVFLRPVHPLIDVIDSPEPAPVLMPWGSVALASVLGAQQGSRARVVVPR